MHDFSHTRLDLPDVHGTGCTLSAAITARLARGEPLLLAVEGAIGYLVRCLDQHFEWTGTDATVALNHFPDDVD
jgi:hydroxymethylpyrimidine/phosphomethylpyrimidine kinase